MPNLPFFLSYPYRVQDVFADGTNAEDKVRKVLDTFAENDVDHTIVETLTDDDLAAMKFSLGIRKALLKAIEKGKCQ